MSNSLYVVVWDRDRHELDWSARYRVDRLDRRSARVAEPVPPGRETGRAVEGRKARVEGRGQRWKSHVDGRRACQCVLCNVCNAPCTEMQRRTQRESDQWPVGRHKYQRWKSDGTRRVTDLRRPSVTKWEGHADGGKGDRGGGGRRGTCLGRRVLCHRRSTGPPAQQAAPSSTGPPGQREQGAGITYSWGVSSDRARRVWIGL